MAYELSIEVFGEGEDPDYRSHWGFMINKPQSFVGDLLHVRMIDIDKLWFQFEYRSGTQLATMQAMGKCRIVDLTPEQRQKAIDVIKAEKAPMDGKRRCQDWVFDTLISLEIEELVPSGTSAFWKEMVGKPAKEVAQAAGAAWTDLRAGSRVPK